MAKDSKFRRKKLYREMLKQTRRCSNERNIATKMFHLFMRNFQLNLRNTRRHVSDAGIKAHVAMFNGQGKFLFGFHFPDQLDFRERPYNSHEQRYTVDILYTCCVCIVCSSESLNFP